MKLALASVALRIGNPSLALEALSTIAPDSEFHPEALVSRSQAELQLGDLESARATLTESKQSNPDRPEAHLAHVATLLSEHRYDDAQAAIEARGRHSLGLASTTISSDGSM